MRCDSKVHETMSAKRIKNATPRGWSEILIPQFLISEHNGIRL